VPYDDDLCWLAELREKKATAIYFFLLLSLAAGPTRDQSVIASGDIHRSVFNEPSSPQKS